MRGLIAAILLLGAVPAAAQEVTIATEVAADGSRTMTHAIDVPAPIAEVWTAVATPEGWRSWAVPVVREVPGSPDRFETAYDPAAVSGGPATIEQQWLERTAPSRASFRTTRTPDGFPHADAYLKVTSRFDLAPLGDGATRVRLTATGYPPGAEGDALLGFFREGNRTSLEQLRRRFTAGPIDWSKRAPVPKGR